MLKTSAAALLLVAFFQPLFGYSRQLPRPASQPAPQIMANTGVSFGPNESAFLILTDIHFNPFSDPDGAIVDKLFASPVEKWQAILEASANQIPSPDGADTNYPLFAAALNAAKNSGVRYDYVIAPGDFLAHRFEEKYRNHHLDPARYGEFAIKTELFVSRMIRQSFPSLPIYAALGNNDTTSTDYAAPGESLLAALRTDWKVVASNPAAVKTFAIGGYYAVPHPTVPAQEFIVLNTAFWSRNYAADSASSGADPGVAELDWLKAELAHVRSAHKSATLILHIPPGIDAFASAKPGNCEQPASFWKARYESPFMEILTNSKDLLRDGYAGHTHMTDFRVFSYGGAPFFPMHNAAAVSRDHRNDSGYEIGVYDKSSGALDDYAVVFLTQSNVGGIAENSAGNLNATVPVTLRPQLYDFRQLSGFTYLSPDILEVLNQLVLSSATVRARFLDLFSAHSSASSVLSANWRPLGCAQTQITAAAFAGCACHASP